MKILSWWSGGIASAVACKKILEQYDDVKIVFIDTKNEHPDTYRFLMDCEAWYDRPIETVTNTNYERIEMVWLEHLNLNYGGAGAVCSAELKRKVREQIQRQDNYDHQVFGFDFSEHELGRAISMSMNYPEVGGIYPLLQYGYTKEDCVKILQEAKIELPVPYVMGYRNNNCYQTGCIQGGVGYWKKIKKEEPKKFYKMAVWEHLLTDLSNGPVTVLYQKPRLRQKYGNIFMVPHPDYHNIPSIESRRGSYVKPLVECNGFCGTYDLVKNKHKVKSDFDV